MEQISQHAFARATADPRRERSGSANLRVQSASITRGSKDPTLEFPFFIFAPLRAYLNKSGGKAPQSKEATFGLRRFAAAFVFRGEKTTARFAKHVPRETSRLEHCSGASVIFRLPVSRTILGQSCAFRRLPCLWRVPAGLWPWPGGCCGFRCPKPWCARRLASAHWRQR